jgi:pyridoxal phosphate enzyme (YggS family)
MPTIADQLAALRAQMRAAEKRVGRPPESCSLLAVSKGVSAERVAEAFDAGQRSFGENRVQELEEKRAALAQLRPESKVQWELIGPLQSNKLRRAIAAADRIDSVDRMELLAKIVEASKASPDRISIALQVNTDADPAKAGFAPEELRAALPEVARLLRGTNVVIDGLMTIGRLTEDREESRRSVATFATFATSLRAEAANVALAIGPLLSAGMSGDFEVAIEEGATQVRLGSALFGARG